jgi:hypothetical protein
MTARFKFNSISSIQQTGLRMSLLAALLSGAAAQAQTAAPQPQTPAPVGAMPTTPTATPQSTAATQATVKALTDSKATAIKRAVGPKSLPGVRDGLVTEAGSGRAVGEGSRVLAVPGKCTPKTNSLDCTSDSAQTSGGANVSGRVRNSVIGEVGAGKAATEGDGKAKGTQTCTPAPGKLTCD